MNRISLSPSAQATDTISIPGSKSYTNRALILASLAKGESHLIGASLSKDSEALIAGLRLLGVSIEIKSDCRVIVRGGPHALKPFQGIVDIGPAGTAMRFLTALCATIPGADITLQGTARMHQRPIADLVSSLQAAGATITYLGAHGCPPIRIHSTQELHGADLSIDGSISSQFVSAVALIAPLFKAGLSLRILGEETSSSYIQMTLQSMRDFGVHAQYTAERQLTCSLNQLYAPRVYQVEGDASGASYFWGVAAISQRAITVENINPESAQGDVAFPDVLRRMGCSVTTNSHSITVSGPPTLRAIEASLESMPDSAQTLAIVCACASGTSVIRGLRTLRVKETDRIEALQNELAKVGVQTESGPDYLVVHGSNPSPAQIKTYDDHRMAMSFAMLGSRTPGVIIEDPQVVAKSFPSFWDSLAAIGIRSDTWTG